MPGNTKKTVLATPLPGRLLAKVVVALAALNSAHNPSPGPLSGDAARARGLPGHLKWRVSAIKALKTDARVCITLRFTTGIIQRPE
jgi:hypothetical protein